MSEFSESYHLRSTSRREARDLLASAGLAGFVFPALDGWVSFVAEGESFRPNKRLLRANKALLLHWMYGEDHGWGFALNQGSKRVLHYYCSWDFEIEIDGNVSHAELERKIGFKVPSLAGEAGLRIFFPQTPEQALEVKPAYVFAQAVGLSYYRWLSYSYLRRDAEQGHSLPPGAQAAP